MKASDRFFEMLARPEDRPINAQNHLTKLRGLIYQTMLDDLYAGHERHGGHWEMGKDWVGALEETWGEVSLGPRAMRSVFGYPVKVIQPDSAFPRFVPADAAPAARVEAHDHPLPSGQEIMDQLARYFVSRGVPSDTR